MPKRYEFHSQLTPEEIYVRLRACAKPQKWDSCIEKTFYYKRHKRGFHSAIQENGTPLGGPFLSGQK